MAEEPKMAKIPEGVTVETPKKEELRTLPIPELHLDPTLPVIVNPHYTNNARTELACVLLRPDGMATQEKGIPKDQNHPLYRDIKRQFSEDEVRHNTKRQAAIQSALSKSSEEMKKAEEREKSRADLWKVKSMFLDIPTVKNTEHKNLKRKLRSALTAEEARAFGSAILIKEAEKDGD